MTRQQAQHNWAWANPRLYAHWCTARVGSKYARDYTPDHCAYVARLGNPRAIAVMEKYKALIVTARLKS